MAHRATEATVDDRTDSGSNADPASTGDGPLVSYVIATYNRPDDLAESVASVLAQTYEPIELHVVSNSTDETSELFAPDGRFDVPGVTYHEFPGRMGVPQARNVGYDLADGDIVVTLDDDAILCNADATDEVVRLFDAHEDVGAIAFQCRDYYSGEVNHHETPDPPDPAMSPRETYRATNFVGVGNALRREVLEAVGAFPERFVYGFEEMDLSLRLHDAAYDVLYTPTVVVRHKKSPEGRRTDAETLERLVENRIRIAFRNLPVRYVVCTTLLWSAYGLATTRSVASLRNVFARLWTDATELRESRSVIAPDTISRIKSRRTMLFLWWYGPNPRRILGPDGNLRRLFWEL